MLRIFDKANPIIFNEDVSDKYIMDNLVTDEVYLGEYFNNKKIKAVERIMKNQNRELTRY